MVNLSCAVTDDGYLDQVVSRLSWRTRGAMETMAENVKARSLLLLHVQCMWETQQGRNEQPQGRFLLKMC